MLETRRGTWFSLKWMKIASRRFHYTEIIVIRKFITRDRTAQSAAFLIHWWKCVVRSSHFHTDSINATLLHVSNRHISITLQGDGTESLFGKIRQILRYQTSRFDVIRSRNSSVRCEHIHPEAISTSRIRRHSLEAMDYVVHVCLFSCW
jgi:hypothetical protein